MTFAPHTEDAAHYAILEWLRAVLPGAKILHIANGLYLGSSPQASRHIRRMKALGMTSGAADLLVFPGQGRSLWIEVKRPAVMGPSPKTGKTIVLQPAGVASDEQIEFGQQMEDLGIPWRVCWSIDDARQFLADIGIATIESAQAA